MTGSKSCTVDIKSSPAKVQRGGSFLVDLLIVIFTLAAYLAPVILRLTDIINLPCYFIYNINDEDLPNCLDCYGNLVGEYFVTPSNDFEVVFAFIFYQVGCCYLFFVFFFVVTPTMIPNILTTEWINYLSLWNIAYFWIFTFFVTILGLFASNMVQIWFLLCLGGWVHVSADLILSITGFICLGHWIGLYEDVKLDSSMSIRLRMALITILFFFALVVACITATDIDVAWQGHLFVFFIIHTSIAHIGLPLNYLYAMHGPDSTLKSSFHDKLPWSTLFAIFVIHPIQGFGGAVQSLFGEQTCESNAFVEKGFFFLSTLVISYGVHCYGVQLLQKIAPIDNSVGDKNQTVKEPTKRSMPARGGMLRLETTVTVR